MSTHVAASMGPGVLHSDHRGYHGHHLERTSSACSSLSFGSETSSLQTVGVEQTASVELVSYGSIARPKSCRTDDSSHLMVLGTDRVLLYTEGSELRDRYGEYAVGQSSMSFTSRPGTASSRPGTATSLHSMSSPMKPVAGRETGDRMARAPSISLTASVGSAGELRLPARSDLEWSDDEDLMPVVNGNGGRSRSSQAASTKCRVAVSLNQLVDVLIVDDPQSDTLLVIYCPSTNKLSNPNSLKSRTLQLSQSFRRGLSSSRSVRWRPPKEMLEQVPEDSYHFHVRFASKEAAEAMKIAVLGQAKKFYECMLWLSKQFPVPSCQSSIMMLTCGKREGNRGVGRDTHMSAFTRAFPALGEEIGLPLEVSDGLCGLARGSFASVVTTFYLQTPLGVATAEIGLMDLERSWVDGSAPVEVVGQLRDDSSEAEDGEYRWQVTMTFRVTRGDEVIGKYMGDEDAGDAEEGGNRADERTQGRQSKPVQRRQSHGLGAPLVVSLVALRAAKGVIRRVKGPGGRRGGKKKGAAAVRTRQHGSDRKISPRHLYGWSISVLSIDVSLEPRKLRTSSVARKVSSTQCKVNECELQSTSSHVELPPPIQTLVDRYEVVTHDIATRFLIGLDSETKAYSGLVKMVEFWTEHNLSELRPNPAAFRSMKKHYPHGVIGWSDKSDCLITYEAMGLWPDAFKNVIQDGISEDDILHHMLVCYLFNFQRLDNRAWPDGKAVKIMDLNGLRLGHINTAGFKFITSIANVLAIMFPQRMHQCIFINAPSFWNIAWSVMKNVVPEKVRSQMQVFNRGNQDKARAALLEYLNESELDYLFPGPMLENEYETKLEEYIDRCTSH